MLGDLNSLLLRRHVAAGDLSLGLIGPQVGIVLGDVAQQGQPGGPQVLDAGLEFRPGGLDAAPGAAKDIDFPAGIESGLEDGARSCGQSGRGEVEAVVSMPPPLRVTEPVPCIDGQDGSPDAVTLVSAWIGRARACSRSRLVFAACSMRLLSTGSLKAFHQAISSNARAAPAFSWLSCQCAGASRRRALIVRPHRSTTAQEDSEADDPKPPAHFCPPAPVTEAPGGMEIGTSGVSIKTSICCPT